jgi:hypothetical protein
VPPTLLLNDDFSGLDAGLFSAPVGARTEYHYLPEAAPRGNWAVACFGTGKDTGRAWQIVESEGRKSMVQTIESRRSHTHPMVVTGDPLWSDYTVEVRFTPDSPEGRCGCVVRYQNSRCYYFFGFDNGNVVLLKVDHETIIHQPNETVLASVDATLSPGTEYTAFVTVDGGNINARIEGGIALEAEDAAFTCGRVALLSDLPASFHSVQITAPKESVASFHTARSRQDQELDELREQNPKPVLWKKLSIDGFGVGRNLRFGDLTGSGHADLLVGQVVHHGERDDYSQLSCLTALTFDGDILWQKGTPDPEKTWLSNDVGFQIHDIDGDGRNEVVYCMDQELIVADGATGEVKSKSPTPVSKPPADLYPHILGDCLFFCDTRGIGRPGDIVIKDRYWNFWVLDDELRPLWEGTCQTGHYPFAFDTDGDGHDELAIGYALYDHDGRLLWNLQDTIRDHADGVAVLNFEQYPGAEPRILYTASDDGCLFVSLDGKILKHHHIGHAQNPAVARLRSDLPGLQTVTINFWGNQGILHFYDAAGDIYHSCEPNNFGSMCLPINWTGSGVEYFVHNPNPQHGGMFDGWGRPVVTFPDDGHPDMCNAVLDVTGDCRDEVIVWDPHEVWVYTQDDGPKDGKLYKPVRNSQYNNSNYQASVSLPGWSE